MKNINVKNLNTPQGNKAPNQFIIRLENKVIFKSYESNIVEIDSINKVIKLDKDWKYSSTTTRYLNIFFKEIDFNIRNTDLESQDEILIDGVSYQIIKL